LLITLLENTFAPLLNELNFIKEMKKFFTIILFSSLISLQAQTADSVSIGPGYGGIGYYTLATGHDTVVANNDWDISIASYALFTVSIRINGGFGAELYKSSGDTTTWATLDTAGLQGGITWIRCHDSDTSFEPSAFEAGATGHPNYGWGNYNNITHDVIGDKLFVVRLAGVSAVYKKVWIQKFDAIGNAIHIRVANLDNSADNTIIVTRNSSKNYSYVALATGTVMDREPGKTSFDLIFDRYEANIGIFYPVTGVRSNQGVKITEVGSMHSDDAVTNWFNMYYPSSTNMTEIGHDWKTPPPPSWIVTDSLSYFVEDLQGDVYQVWFTAFRGSATGTYVFNTRQVGWVSVEDQGNVIANFNIFPNPATDFVNVAYTIDNEFDMATLNIININGEIISTQRLGNNQGFNQTMLNIAGMNLSSGIYVAQIVVGNSAATKKFIVQ
jgi:hypothetical protein